MKIQTKTAKAFLEDKVGTATIQLMWLLFTVEWAWMFSGVAEYMIAAPIGGTIVTFIIAAASESREQAEARQVSLMFLASPLAFTIYVVPMF